MWTLILTLTKEKAAAIHSVPGFTTKEMAMAAGKEWVENSSRLSHAHAMYVKID